MSVTIEHREEPLVATFFRPIVIAVYTGVVFLVGMAAAAWMAHGGAVIPFLLIVAGILWLLGAVLWVYWEYELEQRR